MDEKYIISIDQSTQGTKALLFNSNGRIVEKAYKVHQQIVNDKGWVSHNPIEIYRNTINVVKELLEKANIDKSKILCIGLTNQRETSLAWDKIGAQPIDNAIVWQCSRATEIAEKIEQSGYADLIYRKTGLKLSPYFSASKFSWLMQNKVLDSSSLCFGTIDTWLIYKLTDKKEYLTDYSNASRTQLFNIHTLKWDEEICKLFGIDVKNLPEVRDSDSCFGYTDFEGLLPNKVPINAVMGDSHGALFGQNCLSKGDMKCTYGTGSSIMMNTGEKIVASKNGLVTSIGYSYNGKVTYVLEGNLNYTGAIISWLKDSMGILENAIQSEEYANKALKDDDMYIIPAFSGLGAPYWISAAKARIVGMTRTTTKFEIVRASLESIAYQIKDIVIAMENDTNINIRELRVDGGPTKNGYLMQFQSDITNKYIRIPEEEELSGIGVAYMAGISVGMWSEQIFNMLERKSYSPNMCEENRSIKYNGWKEVIDDLISK